MAEVTPRSESLSQQYAFLTNAAVAYWQMWIPVENREVFSAVLQEAISNHMDGLDFPQPARREIAAQLYVPPIRIFRFGVGIYEAYSDSILAKALRAANVGENLLPRETHVTIDTENGNAYVERVEGTGENKVIVRKNIFPIPATLS